jgi:hypothetical protein
MVSRHMVRTFLKVYMELGSYFLFLQEQIKDIIINTLSLLEIDHSLLLLAWPARSTARRLLLRCCALAWSARSTARPAYEIQLLLGTPQQRYS